MAVSMSIRLTLAAAACLAAVAGCGAGADSQANREVRLLAPAGLADDVAPFERRTGCRVDLRVYDDGEDLAAIARRRDVDVVAEPVAPGETPHDSIELVRVEVAAGLEVTIPKELASSFRGTARPAGVRETRWELREEGANEDCARRWLAYATT
jgi:hypothetical protein